MEGPELWAKIMIPILLLRVCRVSVELLGSQEYLASQVQKVRSTFSFNVFLFQSKVNF